MLMLVQNDRVVSSYTQVAPHAGIDLHHCTFVWPPGECFYICKYGLSCLQVECKHTLIEGLHKLYYISQEWLATFSEQGIEAFRRHIGTIECENCLIGLKATSAVA